MTPAALLTLQRRAGNTAVTAMFTGPSIQRWGRKEPDAPAAGRLIDAARSGDIADVTRSIKKGEDVNQTDEFGNTALIYAVDRGQQPMVDLLIRSGADMEIVSTESSKDGSKGETALKVAVLNDSPAMIALLLARGARMDTRDRSAINAPSWAAREGSIQCLNVFLQNGWAINWRDTDGFTLLHWAATAGQLAAAQWLIAGGTDLAAVAGALKETEKASESYEYEIGDLTSRVIPDRPEFADELQQRNARLAELQSKLARVDEVIAFLKSVLAQPSP